MSQKALHVWLPGLVAASVVACATTVPRSSEPQPPGTSSSSSAASAVIEPVVSGSRSSPRSEKVHFITDDMPAAYREAKRTGRILFVDAWAPWCHTCLSLQHYVFTDPSLVPYAKKVVFASIDTDKESSAAFLQRHDVKVWPMLFVIDPVSDKLLASWPGSLSARQLRELLDDALVVRDSLAPPGDPRRLLADARAASAERRWSDAIDGFDQVLAKTSSSWSRRSEAMVGKIWALFGKKDYETCASWGRQHVSEVHGAASPADFSWVLLTCAEHLDDGTERQAAQRAAIDRLTEFVEHPPRESTVDDKADALAILADAVEKQGQHDKFIELYRRRIAMLERAAAQAPTPRMASTFDYARAMSYLALDEGQKAVTMLKKRVEQFPQAYEPAGRLGEVLLKMGKAEEAIVWLRRALKLAYGPRRMRYLKLEADALGKLGRHEEQIEVLRRDIALGESLPPSQLRPGALQAARERLVKAQAAMNKAARK